MSEMLSIEMRIKKSIMVMFHELKIELYTT